MLRSIAELAAYGTFAATTTNALSDERVHAITTDRGALLFAVKGCVGCHIHSEIPGSRMRIGPDLSALAERAGTRVAGLDARSYVRQSLREPSAFAASGYDAQMPDLRLTDEEIESLTTFLLAPPG